MLKFLRSLFGERAQTTSPKADFDLSAEEFAKFRRDCWVPVVESGDGEATASKFSGSAALRPGEAWPECPNCRKPMQLFVQLNTAQFPGEHEHPWPESVLQFFYCVSSKPVCEVDCDGWEPVAKNKLLRVVPLAQATVRGDAGPDAFAPKRIVSWERMDDYPGQEELFNAGVREEDQESIGNLGFPISGEKLLGWPDWVQSIEYPACPVCGKEMVFLFQIDSEVNVPYMFGDAGCGHITYCPLHTDQIAFGWACH